MLHTIEPTKVKSVYGIAAGLNDIDVKNGMKFRQLLRSGDSAELRTSFGKPFSFERPYAKQAHEIFDRLSSFAVESAKKKSGNRLRAAGMSVAGAFAFTCGLIVAGVVASKA